MTLTKDIAQEISDCIELYWNKARRRYPTKLMEWTKPTFTMDVRGTVGGKAFLHENRIALNPVLFRQNKKDFIEDTIPHEVAHLVAFMVYRDNGHGAGWKHVMRSDFGIPPTRCHNYDVSNVKQKYTVRKALYTCECKDLTHKLSLQKHRSKTNFLCKRCRQPIKFTGTISSKVQ